MRIKTTWRVLADNGVLAATVVMLGMPDKAGAQTAASPTQATQDQTASPVPATAGTPAAPAASATPPAAPGTQGLETVVVTAQRRSENLQKVPLSVQALTARTLQSGDVEDLSRLGTVTPGVTFAYSGNDQKINIRGANANNTFEDASPIVGVFVDGVYTDRASEQSLSFFDISQLEVLKGPQGTLYGRNTLAGAININTNAPSLNGYSASLTSRYASFDDSRTEAVVNAPVTDNFAVRLASLYETSDGYFHNADGPNLGSKDNLSVRGSAFWQISDSVNATLRITNANEDGRPAGLFAVSGTCRNVDANGLADVLGPKLDCQNPRRGAGGTPAFDSRSRLDVDVDFAPRERLNDFNTTLLVDADLGIAKLKSITSVTDYRSLLGQDSDFSPNPFEREWFEENVTSYTQELTLSNAARSRLQWTTGLYGSRDEEYFADTKLFETQDVDNAQTRPLVLSANGKKLPVLNGTPLASNTICIDCLAIDDGSGKSFQFLNDNTIGAFAQTTYAVTRKFHLTGGVRYSREYKDTSFNPVNAPYVGPSTPQTVPATPSSFPFQGIPTAHYAKDFDRVTYRASADYELTSRLMGYFTFSTGFLSGALNNNLTTPATGEQTSKSYEVGVKTRFLDNRVQLNADLFRTNYSNLVTSELINGLTFSVNGGAINANGAEILLEAVPIDPLHVTLGLSYVDAQYGPYGVQNRLQVLDGVLLSPNIVEEQGDTPPFSPKWTGTLGVSYDLDLHRAGTLTPEVQFFFSSAYSASGGVVFDPAAFQPAYTKTDVRLIYMTPNHRYSLSLFAENLENNIVNQRTQEGTDGIEQVSWGPPRIFGLELRIKL